LRAQRWVLAEGTHIKYRALALNLKLFYLSVLIDDRNSKLEGKCIAATLIIFASALI
jgi:hypothetical protein